MYSKSKNYPHSTKIICFKYAFIVIFEKKTQVLIHLILFRDKLRYAITCNTGFELS